MDQNSLTPSDMLPQLQPDKPPKSKLKKIILIVAAVFAVLIIGVVILLLISTQKQWLHPKKEDTTPQQPAVQQVDPANGHLGANIKILAPSPAFLSTYSALIDPERPEYFQYQSPDKMCVLAFGLLGGSDPFISFKTIIESITQKHAERGSKLLEIADIAPIVLQDADDSSKTYSLPGKRWIYEDEGIQTITDLNIGIRKDGRRMAISRVCEADPGKPITPASLSQLEAGVKQMKAQQVK